MIQQTLPGLSNSSELHRLAGHFERAAFFDIETATEGEITIVACLQGSRLATFVRGENLDDFLDFLDGVPLLVSYNGQQFDVPQVLAQFHLPELPCEHLDLRKVCRAHALTGGLKSIEKKLGIRRPDDVLGLDGEDAMWMWRAWDRQKNAVSRMRLARYCGADVIGLRDIAAHLLDQHLNYFAEPPPNLWPLLDELQTPEAMASAEPVTPPESLRETALYRRLQAKVRQRKKA